MANKFCWSGASGLNDGSSWDNAYTSMMRDWGAEAGFTPATDFIYVRSVHAETTGGAQVMTGSTAESTTAPCRVICVVGDTTGTTPGNLATGGAITQATGSSNDVHLREGLYVYGIYFTSGDQLFIADSSDGDVVLEQCRLILGSGESGDKIRLGGSSAFGQSVVLLDVDVDFGNTAAAIDVTQIALKWRGGSLITTTNPTNIIDTVNRLSYIELEDLDLSSFTGDVVDAAGVGSSFYLKVSRCSVGTGANVIGTVDVPGVFALMSHCQTGTDADPAYQVEQVTIAGSVTTDTATYRTGGASDDERTNPISWDMDTTVGSRRNYPGHALESPPITGWTDGDGSTAHTYRIYFASGATQQDDDIWFDLVGPNDAATNSLGVRNTTRVAPRGTPANHTTDSSSTWNGTDVGTKQYMEITYTPDKPGPLAARVYMVTDAGATGHIYIDPKIYIDP